MSEDIVIRNLLVKDIPKAMELVFAEKWNQTEKDWEILISGKHNICMAVEISGHLVATATAMNYENKVAWIGMVLVNREFR